MNDKKINPLPIPTSKKSWIESNSSQESTKDDLGGKKDRRSDPFSIKDRKLKTPMTNRVVPYIKEIINYDCEEGQKKNERYLDECQRKSLDIVHKPDSALNNQPVMYKDIEEPMDSSNDFKADSLKRYRSEKNLKKKGAWNQSIDNQEMNRVSKLKDQPVSHEYLKVPVDNSNDFKGDFLERYYLEKNKKVPWNPNPSIKKQEMSCVSNALSKNQSLCKSVNGLKTATNSMNYTGKDQENTTLKLEYVVKNYQLVLRECTEPMDRSKRYRSENKKESGSQSMNNQEMSCVSKSKNQRKSVNGSNNIFVLIDKFENLLTSAQCNGSDLYQYSPHIIKPGILATIKMRDIIKDNFILKIREWLQLERVHPDGNDVRENSPTVCEVMFNMMVLLYKYNELSSFFKEFSTKTKIMIMAFLDGLGEKINEKLVRDMVGDEWFSQLVRMQTAREKIGNDHMISLCDWWKMYDVLPDNIINLSPNISEILESPCKIHTEKTIKETHDLIFMPKDFTKGYRSFSLTLQNFNPECQTSLVNCSKVKYKEHGKINICENNTGIYQDWLDESWSRKSLPNAGWALVYRLENGVPEASRNKTRSEQLNWLDQLNRDIETSVVNSEKVPVSSSEKTKYHIANTLEAVVNSEKAPVSSSEKTKYHIANTLEALIREITIYNKTGKKTLIKNSYGNIYARTEDQYSRDDTASSLYSREGNDDDTMPLYSLVGNDDDKILLNVNFTDSPNPNVGVVPIKLVE